MRNKRSLVLYFLLLVLTIPSEAQKQVNSPYARFNIGTLGHVAQFRSLGMGGTGIAGRDDNAIYYTNPASYTSIDTTSFIFDFGVDLSYVGLNDGKSKFGSFDLNFDHILLGLPMTKKFGLATGIVPVSNGYYYMAQTTGPGDPGYDPLTGTTTTVHKGTGTMSKFFFGSGFQVFKGLSLGVNMNILLGHLTRNNQFEFEDYSSTFNQSSIENLRIHGISLDYGIQYHKIIKKVYFITAGFSMDRERKYRSSDEILKQRFSVYSSAPYSPDTISYYYNNSKDSTVFPSSYRVGLAFGKADKFSVEFDYIYTPWSHGMIHGESKYLADSKSLRLGIEYIPERFSNTSFLKRIEYRLGGHMTDDYLILNGVQIKDYGVSLGFGMRMRESRSKTNFYFDYTRREGDLAAGLPNENIFSFGASLNLYDFWFMKHKYE